MNEQKLSWNWVERRLHNAEVYWLATTRPDGRPHARPVWGLWHEDALWFGTAPGSIKGRSLAATPYAVAHLESGDDVVIVEGPVDVVDLAVDSPLFALYSEKYAMPVEKLGFAAAGSSLGGLLYRLRPEVVHAWLEALFEESRSRWRF